MLSLVELRRAGAALQARFAGFRVERLTEPAPRQLAIGFYGRDSESDKGTKRYLLLSCDPAFARVAELERMPSSADKPPIFLQFIRPRLDAARLRSARLLGEERQLSLQFEGPEGSFEFLLSLLGKRSNSYVLDASGLLLAAQRPLAETRRNLKVGEAWEDPPKAPGASPRADQDRWPDVEAARYLLRIGEHYASSESDRDSEDLGTRLAKVLRKERKSALRRVERIDVELAEADRVGEVQRHGELLKGALGQVRPGANEVRVRDLATEEEVAIPLDPALSPKQNLEATFKRYQKLIRRLTKAGAQSDEAKQVLARIDDWVAEVELAREADDTAALEALAQQEDLARWLRKHAPAAPSAKPEKREAKGPFRELPRKLHPRRYKSSDGLEIWVGRSDEGNDYLSTRLARGKDLFFHLDGAPGSHVILRTEGRDDPPSESLLDACELSVHFSKQKNAGRADVHVVPIKNVKKPKGSKRGLVYVTGGKTVHLRREEARLKRLLAARIDDD